MLYFPLAGSTKCTIRKERVSEHIQYDFGIYTYGKYCGTTNDEIRRYVRYTNFMNALFVEIAPFSTSTAGMPRGNC